MTTEADGVALSQTRARFYRVLILLSPLYLSVAASLLPWSFGDPAEALFRENYFDILRAIACFFPIWLGLLIVPSSALMAAALAGGVALYMAVVAGLSSLAERLGSHGLPVICAAFLAMPLLVAAWPQATFRTWVERIALVLRSALLRGLAGLAAGLLALGVLGGGLLLLGGLLRGNGLSQSLFGDMTHVPIICIAATLAVLLAWEEWAEPLVRRFWALLLPLLLVLGIALAGVAIFLLGQQLDSFVGAASGLSIIAAGLLFAAGTRREPGLLTQFSRLAALPMVLVAGWLLGRAIATDGWQPGYLHICLITAGVLLASVRAWITHLRPGLWLPEGTVTMLLPLLALLGMVQDPMPKSAEARSKSVEIQVVWPVGAVAPDGVARALEEPYNCMPMRLCKIVLQDLDGDGQVEVINITQGNILKRRGESWAYAGSVFAEEREGEARTPFMTPGVGLHEDVRTVDTIEPRFRDLLINGKRVRVSLN